MLSSYVNVLQDDWDEYLSVVVHKYRTAINDATKKTPYFMMYGRECRMPDMFWVKQCQELPGMNDYVYDMSVAMETIWDIIGDKERDNAVEVSRKSWNSKKRFKGFEVGDKVMVKKIASRFFSGEEGKSHIRAGLQDRYTGPYEIISKRSPIIYMVHIHGKDTPMAFKNLKRVVDLKGRRREI